MIKLNTSKPGSVTKAAIIMSLSVAGFSSVQLALAAAGPGCVNGAAGVTTLECGSGSDTGGVAVTTAVGAGAVATGPAGASAFGRIASATGNESTAVGENARAMGIASAALGEDTLAQGEIATAVGSNADAIGRAATSLGSFSNAEAAGSIAIGADLTGFFGSQATGVVSIAIGERSVASGRNSIAIGSQASVTQGNAMVLGSIPGINGATNYVQVGIGTNTPLAPLHISRTDGTALIFVEESNAVQGPRELFEILNNGNPEFRMTNTGNNNSWSFSAGLRFVVKNDLGDWVSRIGANGDMEISGVLTELSDVNAKQDIEPVDGISILKKLENLNISEWSYKDAPAYRHVGPMAQDFHAEFGLGHTDKGIATLDSTGIALAAIKALIEENNALKAQNISMEQRVLDTEQRVHDLELQNQRIEELVVLLVGNQAEKVAVN